MTIDRPRSAPTAASPDARVAGSEGIDDAGELDFAPLEASRLDRIALSARAQALIAAGLAVRAFVLHGIEEVYRRVTLDRGRWLTLESGIYRVSY